MFNVLRNIKNRERIIHKQEDKTEEEEFYDYLMEEEVNRLLDEAIRALPAQCQQVVLLFLHGSSTTEIAEKMGISINTVKHIN